MPEDIQLALRQHTYTTANTTKTTAATTIASKVSNSKAAGILVKI